MSSTEASLLVKSSHTCENESLPAPLSTSSTSQCSCSTTRRRSSGESAALDRFTGVQLGVLREGSVEVLAVFSVGEAT